MPTLLTNYWYIHKAEVGKLIGHATLQVSGLDQLKAWNDIIAARMREDLIYSELADQFLENANVPAIGRLLFEADVNEIGLFTHYATWRCKGVSKYQRGDRISPPKPYPFIYTTLPTPDAEARLELTVNPEHFMSSSASSYMTGQVRLFVLAHAVRVESGVIYARPLAIASADYRFDGDAARNALRRIVFDHGQVRFDQIDAFHAAADVDPPTPDQHSALRHISEEQVKHAFAEIIGEPFIPKDWGGERSDLFTGRLKFDGREIAAAFAFKGPAKWKTLYIADMGSRGDQALRLMTEPVELAVVQHCHQVDSLVRALMRSLAAQYLGRRMFCIIDGADTWRILKAYGKCGV